MKNNKVTLIIILICILNNTHIYSQTDIAFNKYSSASQTSSGGTPNAAFDNSENTSWNSGGYAPAWISVDLGKISDVSKIILKIGQSPSGNTNHQIYKSDDMVNWQLIDEISSYTSNNQILERNLDIKARGIKILTTQSPSWICWVDIKIYGKDKVANNKIIAKNSKGNTKTKTIIVKTKEQEKIPKIKDKIELNDDIIVTDEAKHIFNEYEMHHYSGSSIEYTKKQILELIGNNVELEKQVQKWWIIKNVNFYDFIYIFPNGYYSNQVQTYLNEFEKIKKEEQLLAEKKAKAEQLKAEKVKALADSKKTKKEKELEARIKELENEKYSLRSRFKVGQKVCTSSHWEKGSRYYGFGGEWSCEVVGEIYSVSNDSYSVKISDFRNGNCYDAEYAKIEENGKTINAEISEVYEFKKAETWRPCTD